MLPTAAPTGSDEDVLEHARAILPPGLYSRLAPNAERLDLSLITRAYEFSKLAHAGQKRHSGEDYVVHCEQVAEILADLHLDSVTIASGLIHDVVEDTSATLEDVRDAFGDELARRYAFRRIARRESASPSTGSHSAHKLEQAELIEAALAGLL